MSDKIAWFKDDILAIEQAFLRDTQINGFNSCSPISFTEECKYVVVNVAIDIIVDLLHDYSMLPVYLPWFIVEIDAGMSKLKFVKALTNGVEI